MPASRTLIVAAAIASGACATVEGPEPVHDAALIEAIIEDVRIGWEQGDGTPFYTHFLDWDGARYFEGGNQNVGLQDLVENHVAPEGAQGLQVRFTNIQTHFEGGFAWAVFDTEIRLTTDDRNLHHRGYATYLFRWIVDSWKVVHTQSASAPVSGEYACPVRPNGSRPSHVVTDECDGDT